MPYLRLPQVLLATKVHDKHIRRLHELLLHAAGRNVDLVLMANARSSTSTSDLTKSVMACSIYLFYTFRASCRVERTQPRV